ncbi:hypothetical protein [Vallitalea guaymasensis]|uniref:hypothetical protein n=1 Tax=Vallitalea guaymasensis TaxID=1185412 RepID=UPI000DE2B60B|nr:hypothetical protein [Vallitalea guaymasensis]
MALINGKSFDWSDVNIVLPNLNVEVQEISYDDELEKELTYAKGNRPRGYGTGNYKASGKISMLREDFNEVLNYCKKNNTTLFKLIIPKIIVSYANDDQPIQTDVLPECSFSKRSTGATQGDKTLKVELDLFISGVIESNGVSAV